VKTKLKMVGHWEK